MLRLIDHKTQTPFLGRIWCKQLDNHPIGIHVDRDIVERACQRSHKRIHSRSLLRLRRVWQRGQARVRGNDHKNKMWKLVQGVSMRKWKFHSTYEVMKSLSFIHSAFFIKCGRKFIIEAYNRTKPVGFNLKISAENQIFAKFSERVWFTYIRRVMNQEQRIEVIFSLNRFFNGDWNWK